MPVTIPILWTPKYHKLNNLHAIATRGAFVAANKSRAARNFSSP
jgi:hypothetical protein